MASSSENMASIGTWPFYPGFSDSWLSDAFSRDTEALTTALQHSISNTNLLVPTFTASSISGSDPETTTLKRHRTADDDNNNNVPPTGKVSKPKRKSRTSSSSKRSHTTFIKADPANFRQMVQQVTGFSFGNEQMSPAPMIMKPVAQIHGCLPTLDTSAFLLDQQHPVFDGVASDGTTSLDCDNLPCFPTLESSKA